MKSIKKNNTADRQNQNVLAVRPAWQRFVWPTLALVLLSFMVVLVVGLFMPGRTTSATASGGAVLAMQYVCEGRITRFENGVAELETTFAERFVFDPVAEGFRAPEVGSLQRVALVPFRRSADNVFLARIRTMRKISQYSPKAGGGS